MSNPLLIEVTNPFDFLNWSMNYFLPPLITGVLVWFITYRIVNRKEEKEKIAKEKKDLFYLVTLIVNNTIVIKNNREHLVNILKLSGGETTSLNVSNHLTKFDIKNYLYISDVNDELFQVLWRTKTFNEQISNIDPSFIFKFTVGEDSSNDDCNKIYEVVRTFDEILDYHMMFLGSFTDKEIVKTSKYLTETIDKIREGIYPNSEFIQLRDDVYRMKIEKFNKYDLRLLLIDDIGKLREEYNNIKDLI